jgi:hypothetical protein
VSGKSALATDHVFDDDCVASGDWFPVGAISYEKNGRFIINRADGLIRSVEKITGDLEE